MKGGSRTASVYAEALAELASEAGIREAVEEELLGVSAAVQADPAVWKFFRSPVLAVEARMAVIEKVFRGRVGELVYNFLRVLANRKRLDHLPAIASAYTQILDRALGRRRVELTTAVPLSETERSRIAEAMQIYLKATIVLSVKEDRELIGGLVIRSSDILIDTSLRSGLRRIRAALKRRRTIGGEYYED